MYNITIIIPVYNVQDYIERCLDSIMSQESVDYHLECVLVNDCTTDRSMFRVRPLRRPWGLLRSRALSPCNWGRWWERAYQRCIHCRIFLLSPVRGNQLPCSCTFLPMWLYRSQNRNRLWQCHPCTTGRYRGQVRLISQRTSLRFRPLRCIRHREALWRKASIQHLLP